MGYFICMKYCSLFPKRSKKNLGKILCLLLLFFCFSFYGQNLYPQLYAPYSSYAPYSPYSSYYPPIYYRSYFLDSPYKLGNSFYFSYGRNRRSFSYGDSSSRSRRSSSSSSSSSSRSESSSSPPSSSLSSPSISPPSSSLSVLFSKSSKSPSPPQENHGTSLEAVGEECCQGSNDNDIDASFTNEAEKIVIKLSERQELSPTQKPNEEVQKEKPPLQCAIDSVEQRGRFSGRTGSSSKGKCIKAAMRLGVPKYGTCHNGPFKSAKEPTVTACNDENLQDIVPTLFDKVVRCTGEDSDFLFSLWNHESRFIPNAVSGTGVIGIGQVTSMAIGTLNNNQYNPQSFFTKPECENLKKEISRKDSCGSLNPLTSMVYGALHVKYYREEMMEPKIKELNEELQRNQYPPIKEATKTQLLVISYNVGCSLFGHFENFVRQNIIKKQPHLNSDLGAFMNYFKDEKKKSNVPQKRINEMVQFLDKVKGSEEDVNKRAGQTCGGIATL